MTATNSDSPRPKSWRRLRWLVVLLLLPEALYLLAGNLFLNTDLGPSLLSRRPERTRIDWQGGWTWLPGRAQVDGFVLKGQTPKMLWQMSVDKAALRFAPGQLYHRRFHATSIVGQGFALQLARRRGEDGAPAAEAPSITGFAAPTERRARARRKPGWTLDLAQIEVDGIHQIWLDRYRFDADDVRQGKLRGRYQMVIRGAMAAPEIDVQLPTGTVRLGDDPLGQLTTLEFLGDLAPHKRRDHPGPAWIRFLSGKLEARSPDLGAELADYYFRGSPIAITGQGDFHADLGIERGFLLPASRVDIDNANLAVGYLSYRGRGSGRLTAIVEAADTDSPEAGTPQAIVDLILDDFGLSLTDNAEEHVQGKGWRLHATSPTLDLLDAEPEISAELQIPPSKISDLAFYNRYLPMQSPLQLLAGDGTLAARFEISTADLTTHGQIELSGQDVAARFQDTNIRGSFELVGKLTRGDLQARKFDLAGSHLRVETINHDNETWWAQVELPTGEVELSRPIQMQANLVAAFKDPRPIVALIAEKKPRVEWLSDLLKLKDLKVRSHIALQSSQTRLRDFELTGSKRLEILGQLRLAENSYSGLMHLALGPLSAAIAMQPGGERKWKIVGSRRWYRARLDDFENRGRSTPKR